MTQPEPPDLSPGAFARRAFHTGGVVSGPLAALTAKEIGALFEVPESLLGVPERDPLDEILEAAGVTQEANPRHWKLIERQRDFDEQQAVTRAEVAERMANGATSERELSGRLRQLPGHLLPDE